MKAQKIPRVVRFYAAAARWVLPRDFRREYGDPLTDAFHDLHAAVADRGIRRWGPIVREFILLGVTGVRSRMGTGRRRRIAAVDSPQRTSNEVLGSMLRDIRHGIRSLARQPSYTLSAVATLALGIGANTAIFSVVHAVLQEPPPYPEPDRIVYVFETHPRFTRGVASPAGFRDWAGETEVFESIAAVEGVSLHLQGPAGPEQMFGRMVSPSFFQVMGVAPLLGRPLVEGDDEPGNDIAVLGHGIWQRHFNGDSSAVGASLVMNGKPYTIVGVMPEGFSFPSDAEVWVPLTLDADTWSRRTWYFLQVMGRLRPGITLEQGQERMDALAARIAAENPRSHAERGIGLERLHDVEVSRVAANLWMLFGAVGFVLLIACTNVANLSLSRAVARSREMSVRAALGAGRGRIVRQLLVESGLLGLLGGLAGVATAHLAARGFVLLTPSWFPRTDAVSIDGTVLLYTLLISLATGLAFGIVPALKLARLDIGASLGSPRSGLSRRGLRLARGMVVTQVALALLLFVGAGLLVRSFQRLVAQPTGFTPKGVLYAEVPLPLHLYPDESQDAAEFFATLLGRVRGLPGVMSAAVTNNPPFAYYWYGSDLMLEPEPGAEEIEAGSATHRVSAGYFESLGLPVLSGRPLEPGDDARAPRVAVVNEEFVRAHLAGKDPLAARLRRPNNQEWFDIVGVVGSAKHRALDDELEPAVYFSMRQQPAAFMWVLLKAAGDPLALASALREEVGRLDRSVPVTEIATMETLISRTLAEPRFYSVLLSAFAVTAVALACIGVYGLLSYLVAQRTHEIGIRMALGARPEQVRALVVGRGLALTVPGVVIGLLAAYGLTRVLRSLLYQITPEDPLTFGAVTVVFLGLAVLASYGPARRGTSVPPAEALRAE